MGKLQLKRELVDRARERAILTIEEKRHLDAIGGADGGKGSFTAEVGRLPMALLRALLDDTRLTPNQRAVVAMHVYGMSDAQRVDRDAVYSTRVADPVEFGSTFVVLGGRSPNCELFLNGRWYPVVLNVEFLQDKDHLTRAVVLRATLSLCESAYMVSHSVYPDLFLDEAGGPEERTVLDVLQHFGFRRLETAPGEYNLKLVKAERAAREVGRVVLVSGPVLANAKYDWWSRFESRALGTPELPRRAVVEPELEVSEENRHYYSPYGQSDQGVSRLPFVRVFSLDSKAYVYADGDDVVPYEFDRGAMERLHLPPGMLAVLTRVFETPAGAPFGDLIRGKHGGAVVLACGRPGVGKTLTAEVYAERSERPLYVLELGELGTTPAEVEENGRQIRNLTRLARIVHPDGEVTLDQMRAVLGYGCA